MSNQVVGNVYQQIIEKVIQASQNDFEEFGVDQSTLDEMKQGWQDKLSALKVAQFPWDPQPEPPRQPPTVPSNVKADSELPPVSAPQENINYANNVPIKSEGQYDRPMHSYPQQVPNGNYSTGFNQDLAQQRAAALVSQRQQQQFAPQQQQQHHGGQVPMGHPQQQQTQQQQQQQRMMAQQHQRPPQPMQQRPPQGHVYTSQTDGSGDALADWKALVAARAAESEENRIAADEFMRARVDALAMRQDSGLMMPLSEMPKGKKRKAAVRVLQAEDAEKTSSTTQAVPGPARFDGDDDVKEEDPDDAINSDLDDPEDDLDNGDNSDDETMDYMLCTYDKVQRVKNKWKCTLKDGILTTNKKEYLFHKANGEFEW